MDKKKKPEIVEVVAKRDKPASVSEIENMIFSLRGTQVMLDSDLAMLYGIETRVLNQAVKRNVDRFPDDFMFRLTTNEYKNLKSQIVTSSSQPLKTLQLTLDLQRHNAQYKPIAINEFQNAHDLFLCIDNTVYHIGASLKDLGKKWFAFSRMEDDTNTLLKKK